MPNDVYTTSTILLSSYCVYLLSCGDNSEADEKVGNRFDLYRKLFHKKIKKVSEELLFRQSVDQNDYFLDSSNKTPLIT